MRWVISTSKRADESFSFPRVKSPSFTVEICLNWNSTDRPGISSTGWTRLVRRVPSKGAKLCKEKDFRIQFWKCRSQSKHNTIRFSKRSQLRKLRKLLYWRFFLQRSHTKISENFLNILDFFVLWVPKCQKNGQVPKCQKIVWYEHTKITNEISEFKKSEIFIGISLSGSTRK